MSAIDASLDASSSAVVIYPNPINGSSTIEIRGANNDNIHQWTLYNHLGVIVNQKPFLGLSTTLETGSLPSGMYFYKVTNNGAGIQSGNLIISN
ncbi:MAG: T9SS type A sorting domain-containing protein [Saprospiraceae bacterium]|nr:T9SS type A sorting domain-containing protein [Saprospiraceae bacterium]